MQVVMTRYAHASNKLLGIQIDAAINPGSAAHLALFTAPFKLLSNILRPTVL